MPGVTSNYSKLTAEQLRQKLRGLNKDITGKKDVLIARLEGKNEYELLTVAELRQKLKREGKDSTGTKSELIARLMSEEATEHNKKRKDPEEATEEQENKKEEAQEPAKKVKTEKKVTAAKKTKEGEEKAEEKNEAKRKEEEGGEGETEDSIEQAGYGEEDKKEQKDEQAVDEIVARIKLVKHNSSIVGLKSAKGFVEAYKKQVKKMLAATFCKSSINMFVPRTNQFTLSALVCHGIEYKVLLERSHDHPVGAVWYSPDPKAAEWDWFGEASLNCGWIGGREDAPDLANDTMMRAIEKWFDKEENQEKTKYVYKEPKYNPYHGYGRAS